MTQKKPISIIVAIAENYAIGKDNDLLWHISDDLKRFKRLTTNHPVIMGKNTFYSLPFRPLPKRTNIVLSDKAGELIEGCVMAYSIEEAIEKFLQKLLHPFGGRPDFYIFHIAGNIAAAEIRCLNFNRNIFFRYSSTFSK